MENVCPIALSREPRECFVAHVDFLAEQPQQTETDENAHHRLVDAKPLPNEIIPCTILPDIVPYSQSMKKAAFVEKKCQIQGITSGGFDGHIPTRRHHHTLVPNDGKITKKVNATFRWSRQLSRAIYDNVSSMNLK